METTKGVLTFTEKPFQPHDSDCFSVPVKAQGGMANHFIASVKGYTAEECTANAERICFTWNNYQALESRVKELENSLTVTADALRECSESAGVPTYDLILLGTYDILNAAKTK